MAFREYRIHVQTKNDYFDLDRSMTTWGHGKYSAGDRLAQELADAYGVPETDTISLRMWMPDAPRKRWTCHINGPDY